VSSFGRTYSARALEGEAREGEGERRSGVERLRHRCRADRRRRASLLRQINQINALQKHPEWINRLAYNTFDGRVTLDRADCTVRNLAEMSAWLTASSSSGSTSRSGRCSRKRDRGSENAPVEPHRGTSCAGSCGTAGPGSASSPRRSAGQASKLDTDILRKWLVAFAARGLAARMSDGHRALLARAEGGGFKTQFARVMAGAPSIASAIRPASGATRIVPCSATGCG
jgi:hypothetical protein